MSAPRARSPARRRAGAARSRAHGWAKHLAVGAVVPDSHDLRVPAPAARAPEDVAGRVAEGRQILNPYAFEDL